MKVNLFLSISFVFLLATNGVNAQEFFSGTKSPTTTISRTGITNLGFVQFRNNPSIGAAVLEHIHPEGNLFIRSWSSADQTGDVIINDNGGFVGVGTTNPREKLSVNGNIRAREIKVETANWPDYVLRKDYDLKSLSEVEKYINENGHLPEIPMAEEVEANGVSLGEMNKLLLKKVEELTLHLIEKEKRIGLIEKELADIKKNINQNKQEK